MGSRGYRGPGFGLWILLLLVSAGALVQGCSDNNGTAGPSKGPVAQTGHADTTAQIRVQVAVNPNTVELGRPAGITVLVTNLNGRGLPGKHVQLSTDVGTLNRVDGFTDRDGKFVAFLTIRAADTTAGETSATVTAFVEGAVGTGVVNFGVAGVLTISPPAVTRTQGATGGDNVGNAGNCTPLNGFSVQFTVSGGVPPYIFSTAGALGATISSTGLYTAPSQGSVAAGFTGSDTVTAVDAVGNSVSATITVSCVQANINTGGGGT